MTMKRIKLKMKHIVQKSNKGPPCLLSPDVQKTILNSKVFMYPELLPVCSFRRHLDKRKPNFTPAEDHLIALGLEQFSSIENPIYYIRTLLLPSKTENQLKIRIKNCKSRESLDNPIKYCFAHKEAPPVPRVLKIFDPQRVIAPKEYSPDMLPKWMKPYCATDLSNTQMVTFIDPGDGVSPVVAVVQPPLIQQPKRYLPILPRTLPCPPQKQVSPILQNFDKSKRSKIMPNKSKKHVINKFRAIKPRPTELNISNSNPETSDFNCINNLKISDVASLKDNAFLQNQTVCLTSKQISAAVPVINNQELNQATSLPPSQISETLPVANNEESNENQPFHCSDVNEFEVQIKAEICDETDDEVIDNKQDLVALMTASNTIYKKRHTRKKRSKLQSDLESSLALLQPNLMENKQKEKEALFANSYLLRVTERLRSDPETWERFLKALCNYQNSTKSPVQHFCGQIKQEIVESIRNM
ncbi:GON-4-like protein isoform X2 [Stegodyphus dumicola]|uniref:GON-4-like protein isoform X2 n=1 Tax=Stegodyphus dumicola TaxID=202533 RepID=UPI0015AB15DB|nr:GON-4-like protein isoform X2 [Stegodyphus dumicola]